MGSKIKDLFYIPTWCYLFIAAASVLAILTNIYFYTKIGTLESISVDGMRYAEDTVEFVEGVREIKTSLMSSGLIAIAALAFSSWKLSKRIKKLS